MRQHRERFVGSVFGMYSDEVVMPDGTTAWRDYTHHLGAVAVVALGHVGPGDRDADDDLVTLIYQYRHPIRRSTWELPAGLLDIGGESPLVAAQRELAEEADLAGAKWHLLAEVHTSPGYSDELIRIFLARELTPVPAPLRHVREHEEAEMITKRVPLDEAVGMALRGEITNAPAVVGILATARARDEGWAPLRPAT